MIRGHLVKFEPTDKGITVTIKADDKEVQNIVNLYKQEVVIIPSSEFLIESKSYSPNLEEQVKLAKAMLDDILEVLQ